MGMSRCYPEPTLYEALSDPLIRVLMAADRVDPRQLAGALRDMAGHLARRQGAAAVPAVRAEIR